MEPSPREVEAIRKDTERWRRLASQLLKYDHPGMPEKDINFLDDILDERRPETLAYRQAEWLLDIKERSIRVKRWRGYLVTTLLRICRDGYVPYDPDIQEWLDKLHESARDSFYQSDARRLYSLADQLGEV